MAKNEMSSEAGTNKTVKIVPFDRPDGRIVVMAVDRGGLPVRPLPDGPVIYETVAALLEVCAAAGITVLGRWDTEEEVG